MKASNDRFESDFSVDHRLQNERKSDFFHFHPDVEIFFNISGVKSCLLDDKLISVNEGDLIIINPNQLHRFLLDENAPYERHVIVSKLGFLDKIQEGNEILEILSKSKEAKINVIALCKEEREKLLSLLDAFYKEETSEFKTLSKIRFEEIFIYICSLIKKELKKQKKESYNLRIEPILRYINENYKEIDCSLLKIAKGCNMSKHYLCEMFKKYTSMTVNSYVISKKIIYAKELLNEGKNVSECFELCGFNDYSNFIRVFKKYTGITPKQYQIKQREM